MKVNFVDLKYRYKTEKKELNIIFNRIIKSGNLIQSEENRNLEFIIDCFKNTNLNKKYFLKIIGGPSSEVNRLKEYVKEIGLEKI